MRIAILSVDNREGGEPAFAGLVPHLGTAPNALVEGLGLIASGYDGPNPPFEVHIICCLKQLPPETIPLGANVYYHPILLPHWSYLRTLHSGPVLAVRRKLREIRPDIVHAQGTERWCAISAALAPYSKVLTIHGNLRLINRLTPMEPRAYWKLQEILETFSIPRFDGVICITRYTEQNIADLARKTWVVPNAVNSAFFKLGDENKTRKASSGQALSSAPVDLLGTRLSPPEVPKVLVIANIQPRKNQNAFIDALASLATALPFQLRFFGTATKNSDYDDSFFERVKKHEWCHYGGMLAPRELREEYRNASLLVLSSIEDNCPMSVLEAMASGVPIVASNVGGVPDLIQDGRNGLLIDPASADSMRSAVARILRDPEFAAKLACQARKDAEEKYHPRVIARKHLEIYGEVIAARR